MRPNMIFFQNGARCDGSSSILDGQGHVTAVHLDSLRVSEIIVPSPRVRVSLRDMLRRNFIAVLLHSALHLGHVHTGTANTAVLKTVDGIVAVEEASKPYRLILDDEKTRIVGGQWLFEKTPIAAHGASGISNFTYSPFRAHALHIDGAPVDVPFSSFPFMIHSAARVRGDSDVFVLPVMSARFGNFWEYVRGRIGMPLDETFTSEWLLVNRTSGETAFIDTRTMSNPLHVVEARRVGDQIEIYASHVASFTNILEETDAARVAPALSFRKDVLDLGTMSTVSTHDFVDASGDFPNRISRNLVLINRLNTDGREQELVYFDTQTDRVVRRVHVEAGARDIIYHKGKLLFCTLDHFLICDARDGRVLTRLPIPPRLTNFHAALIEA